MVIHELAAKFLQEQFPDRFHFIKGDSRDVLPVIAVQQKHLKFDCIHVDGGHGVNICRTDISNSIRLADQECILILDDTKAQWILDIYLEFIHQGFLVPLPEIF